MTFPSEGSEATPGKWARRRRGDFPDLYIADGRVVAEDGIPTTKRHGALLLTDRSAHGTRVHQQLARCTTAADHDRRRVLSEATRRRRAPPQASPISAPSGPALHVRSEAIDYASRLGA